MVNIYGVKISGQTNFKNTLNFLSFISKEKRLKIQSFRNKDDFQRGLIGELLIRFVLCTSGKFTNEELMFGKNYYGKPFLNYPSNIYFNISHSGDWVVCATDSLPLGIDIEQINSIDVNISKRFFSENEFSRIILSDKCCQLSLFYDLWTLKESYIKAVGKGLSISLDSFIIDTINDNIVVRTNKGLENYYFKQYNIDSGYKLSVCAQTNSFSQNFVVWSDLELYSMFMKLMRCKDV